MTRRTKRPRVEHEDSEDDSDEYQPDESDTDSEDESDDEPVRIRRKASTPEPMHLETSLAQGRTRTTPMSAVSPSSVKVHPSQTRPFTQQIRQRAEALGAVSCKRKRPNSNAPEGTHASWASHRTQHDMSSPQQVYMPSPAMHQTPGQFRYAEESFESDPLYRARMRSVELLADLHRVKIWLEKLHADVLKNAPPHIRDTLGQSHI